LVTIAAECRRTKPQSIAKANPVWRDAIPLPTTAAYRPCRKRRGPHRCQTSAICGRLARPTARTGRAARVSPTRSTLATTSAVYSVRRSCRDCTAVASKVSGRGYWGRLKSESARLAREFLWMASRQRRTHPKSTVPMKCRCRRLGPLADPIDRSVSSVDLAEDQRGL
jgi:hypothetical protein